MTSKISTFGRYLYLNIYAYLLILLGIGIALIPLYRIHWSLAVIQLLLFAFIVSPAIKILSRWREKKRSYHVLIERNRNGIREELFKEYMQAPCGRLLVRVVLKDLGESRQYKIIKKKYNMTWRDCIKAVGENRKPQKTVMYIADGNGGLKKLE